MDLSDGVTRFVVNELAATYNDGETRVNENGEVEIVSLPLNTKHVESVIRYIRTEELYPTDGNDLAVQYLIKHLYGILEQVG